MLNSDLFLKNLNEESTLRFPIFRFKHFEDFSAVNFPSLKLLSWSWTRLRSAAPCCQPGKKPDFNCIWEVRGILQKKIQDF